MPPKMKQIIDTFKSTRIKVEVKTKKGKVKMKVTQVVEGTLKKLLTDCGLTEITKDNTVYDSVRSKKPFEKWRGTENNIFVHQPFSSQASPDFILVIDGIVYYIEHKSGKVSIMFNSHIPGEVPGVIYFVSTTKHNIVTPARYFWGNIKEWESYRNDLISFFTDQQKVHAEFNKRMETKYSGTIRVFYRKMVELRTQERVFSCINRDVNIEKEIDDAIQSGLL